MGASLRTCKEKFYGAVHAGLMTWVGAAGEDGWEVGFVREGPGRGGVVSPRKGKGMGEEEGGALRLDLPMPMPMPKLDFGDGDGIGGGGGGGVDDGDWL